MTFSKIKKYIFDACINNRMKSDEKQSNSRILIDLSLSLRGSNNNLNHVLYRIRQCRMKVAVGAPGPLNRSEFRIGQHKPVSYPIFSFEKLAIT